MVGRIRWAALVSLLVLFAPGCRHEPAGTTAALTNPGPLPGPRPEPAQAREERGQATYYADSLAGHRTASGERYDPRAFTAAHRTLPFGTLVKVVRVDDGRAVTVRINDRGPFAGDERVIDLSRAAAEELGMMRAGVVAVRVVLP